MQQTTYKTYQVDKATEKRYQLTDTELITSFDINSLFVPEKHEIELHVYSVDGELLQSNHKYSNQAYLQGAETAGTKGASKLSLNPEKDALNLGYEYGGIRLSYNFLDNLFSELKSNVDFFIEEISPDRTEIRLLTTKLTDEEIRSSVKLIQEKLKSTSYFSDFRVNLKKDNLLIGINIGVQDYKESISVIVKLYEPLPTDFTLKNTLTLEEVVSDSVTFEIEAETITDEIKVPYLKGPNFNLDLSEESTIPSQYLNYEELFSFPTNNTYRELRSLFEEKSINISIDYTNYENFVQFSSADERLRNFKYKLDLIESYQSYLDSTGSLNVNNSYYEGLINNILENFDHYDRHLYYESGSTSWPKVNTIKPYINATGPSTGSWWNNQIGTAVLFDQNNPNRLINTVPTYLREDPNNEPYNVFLNMLGQHFDNLWIYSKAVTDKYDADNRLDKGISKDLIQDALKNFGLKLYTSNKSTEDLFKTFTGEFYQPGEEVVNTFITASTNPTSEENYRREVYKRLYHNLPLLLKSKGTERAARVLLNSFGIPTLNSTGSHTGLYIRTQGGDRTDGSINLGPQQQSTSSLANIKIDKTGSLISGSTLSIDTSINKRPTEFTDQIHSVEIGYSVAEYQNNQIYSALTASGFNIDDIIGDPALAYSASYKALNDQATSILKDNTYNLQEFTRLLKFYDNVVFKMVKDFVPARSNTNTGIVVKPHLLERNKIKQVETTGFEKIYTGSIEVGTYEGSDGGAYLYSTSSIGKTSYTASVMTKDGPVDYKGHLQEEAKYDGELSGSYLKISQTDIPPINPFKYKDPNVVKYKVNTFEISTCSISFKTPVYDSPDCIPPTPTPTPTRLPVAPSPTPTETPTPTPTSNDQISWRYDKLATISENGICPVYTIVVSDLNGTTGGTSTPANTCDRVTSGYKTRSIPTDKEMTFIVSRTAPDYTVADTAVIQWYLNGTLKSTRSILAGQELSLEGYTFGNLNNEDQIEITISEG